MVYGANGDTGRKPKKMTKAKKPAGKTALKGLKPGSKEFMAKLRSMKKNNNDLYKCQEEKNQDILNQHPLTQKKLNVL